MNDREKNVNKEYNYKKGGEMKKQLLLIIALLTTIPTAAFKLTVRNLSKRQVEMRIGYKRKKCPVAPSYMGFMPGEKKVLMHGACCIRNLKLIPRTGPGAKGPFGPFSPPHLTGYGLSCAKNQVRIVDVPDGGLAIENDEKRDSGYEVVVQNETKYPLQVKIRYLGAGACPEEYVHVKPHGSKRHYAGRGSGVYRIAPCCPTYIGVRTTRGPKRATEWHYFKPKRTGVKMQSCRDNKLIVRQRSNGSLRIKGS